jgi:hypothetical protein
MWREKFCCNTLYDSDLTYDDICGVNIGKIGYREINPFILNG